MTDSELIKLARRDGVTALYAGRRGKTSIFILSRVSFFGRRFLIVRSAHGLPVKLINEI